jgi:alpha-beta hydrolase superfamily lysophospholipase
MAVGAAAEDTERLRRIFVAHVGTPKRTILHGQSWGAMVAAKGADRYAAGAIGRSPYDGVLLTNGVIGGSRSYDFRLDLRAVYQHVCGNHPRPDEPAYSLWAGLPEGARLTPAELRSRIDECLGLDRSASARTPDQVRKGRTIAEAVRVPESSIPGHLARATWDFQELARRYGNLPVMGNVGARYPGVPDEAIDRIGARYRADPIAAARYAEDADPSGRLAVPTLTAHGIHDATAFVELESAFAERVARAGSSERLVQVFTDDREHSYIADPLYPALVDTLLAWIEDGKRPTPAAVQARCAAHESKFGKGCRVLPDFRPAALESRVAPRARP